MALLELQGNLTGIAYVELLIQFAISIGKEQFINAIEIMLP